jgi:hypothetical protein
MDVLIHFDSEQTPDLIEPNVIKLFTSMKSLIIQNYTSLATTSASQVSPAVGLSLHSISSWRTSFLYRNLHVSVWDNRECSIYICSSSKNREMRYRRPAFGHVTARISQHQSWISDFWEFFQKLPRICQTQSILPIEKAYTATTALSSRTTASDLSFRELWERFDLDLELWSCQLQCYALGYRFDQPRPGLIGYLQYLWPVRFRRIELTLSDWQLRI